jgi:hypothetical protein
LKFSIHEIIEKTLNNISGKFITEEKLKEVFNNLFNNSIKEVYISLDIADY